MEDLKFFAIANGALLLSRLACFLESAGDWLYIAGLNTPVTSQRYEEWCYRTGRAKRLGGGAR